MTEAFNQRTSCAEPRRRQVLGFAVDAGSLATLRALCEWDCFLIAAECGGPGMCWEDSIAAATYDTLITGTSDSLIGRELEARACRRARQKSMKVVVIEDYVGNFVPLVDAPANLLVVESIAAEKLHQFRWGNLCPPTFVCAAVRYEDLRRRHVMLRARQRSIRSTERSRSRVLWAGQPETEHSVATLSVLLPVLRAEGVVLLFKAHPRDPQRRSSLYHQILEDAKVDFVDVGDLSFDGVMSYAPDMVITQFSSLAIEAGFYGVPSVLVLLPAHGSLLLSAKGYKVPPWCLDGGAFYAESPSQVAAAIRAGICDESSRARILRCFDKYFQTDCQSVRVLIDRLQMS